MRLPTACGAGRGGQHGAVSEVRFQSQPLCVSDCVHVLGSTAHALDAQLCCGSCVQAHRLTAGGRTRRPAAHAWLPARQQQTQTFVSSGRLLELPDCLLLLAATAQQHTACREVPPPLSLAAARSAAASCTPASSARSLRVLPREAYLSTLLLSRELAGLRLLCRLCFFVFFLVSLLPRPINPCRCCTGAG